MICGKDKYVLSGDRTEVSDFILNKSIKVKASGKAVLKDREQFKYNICVLNKIMPDIDLNDLITAPQEEAPVKKESEPVNITAILEGIYDNRLTADADADLKIEKDNINGYAKLTNVSVINLPPSSAELKFKGKSIDVISDIYTEMPIQDATLTQF